MACQTFKDDQTIYEMMSMLLDGQLDADAEHRLHAHIADCTDCASHWAAMKEADNLLLASARTPLLLTATFTAKVMERIAAEPVLRPEWASNMVAAPLVGMPAAISVLPTQRHSEQEREDASIQMPDYVHEWQHRVSTYVRGVAAIGFSVAGAAGLVLALVLSGAIQVGGDVAPLVSTLHTFFLSVTAWARSLFSIVAPAVLVSGAVLVVLLGLVGGQFVLSYHRAAGETTRLETFGAEAAA